MLLIRLVSCVNFIVGFQQFFSIEGGSMPHMWYWLQWWGHPINRITWWRGHPNVISTRSLLKIQFWAADLRKPYTQNEGEWACLQIGSARPSSLLNGRARVAYTILPRVFQWRNFAIKILSNFLIILAFWFCSSVFTEKKWRTNLLIHFLSNCKTDCSF